MRKFLFLLFLTSQFGFCQGSNKQIGINVISDLNWYEDWRMGTQFVYTNQRHFVSAGIKFVYPKKQEFGLFGYDLNYRIYPNLPKKVFNIFFRVGIDFKRIDNSYDWKYISGPDPSAPVFPAEWKDNNTTLALSLGYGFDLNITKNLFLSTSMSAGYYWRRSDKRILIESSPPSVEGFIYRNNNFTPILIVGIGYNLSLKRMTGN